MWLVIALLSLLLASPSWAFQWQMSGPLLDSQSWDYSPSWMADTVVGYDRTWWCSGRFGVGEPPGEGDVIKYSSGVSTLPQVVLTPNMSGWEGPCVCDPAVVRGAFNVGGQTYSHAMYYTASPNCGSDNKIGIAFSNDGVNWVKYSGNPIIKSAANNCGDPSQICISTYGAGQAQARNWNGQAGVELWYTDTNGAQGSGIYERSSNDGISFGPVQKLSTVGIDCAPACVASVGVALSPGAPWELHLFIRRNGNGALYKIPFDQRFSGTWVFLDDFTPAEAGTGAVFEGGFRTDIYGNLFGQGWPTIWVGFGAGPCYIDTPNCDATQWSLRQAGGN